MAVGCGRQSCGFRFSVTVRIPLSLSLSGNNISFYRCSHRNNCGWRGGGENNKKTLRPDAIFSRPEVYYECTCACTSVCVNFGRWGRGCRRRREGERRRQPQCGAKGLRAAQRHLQECAGEKKNASARARPTPSILFYARPRRHRGPPAPEQEPQRAGGGVRGGARERTVPLRFQHPDPPPPPRSEFPFFFPASFFVFHAINRTESPLANTRCTRPYTAYEYVLLQYTCTRRAAVPFRPLSRHASLL